jgi:hypothetical protein
MGPGNRHLARACFRNILSTLKICEAFRPGAECLLRFILNVNESKKQRR